MTEMAKSAATMLAMSGDEFLLSPASELGLLIPGLATSLWMAEHRSHSFQTRHI